MPTDWTSNGVVAGIGALVGLLLVGVVGRLSLGATQDVQLLIAPMGAAAVLLFAAPDSPLARPWSVIGGNTISAVIGVTCGKFVVDPIFAAPLACGVAVTTMMLARCLHPPGGAVALTAVIGGPAIQATGYGFAIWPVAISAALLLLTGMAFGRLRSRTTS